MVTLLRAKADATLVETRWIPEQELSERLRWFVL